ncbi:MAG: hypothetical protein JXR69_06955 [Candidatus Delongbacteria bacterium]|nr:hypothetical protein [Candidatus Delongbacteria bacterium]
MNKKNVQMNTISKSQLEDAINFNLGIKTLIAKELKVCRNTLDKYIKKYNLTDCLEEQKEDIRDLVRFNIVEAIRQGDIKVSQWYAERQMFEEYGNKQHIETNLKLSEKHKKIIEESERAEQMTDEELQAEIDRMQQVL